MSHHPHFRTLILPICAGIALLVASNAASAQGTGTATTGSPAAKGTSSASLSAADKAFVQKAAIGGLAEVEMGKLAQQKAASDQVKQFATHMVDDHSKANDELKQVASGKGITLPSEPDAEHKSKMAKLQKLSGAEFDRAYMDEMVADHKKDVAEFQKQAKSGQDADLKGFASKTLPTLQDHLKMAQSTQAAVKGGGNKSASAGGVSGSGG
jgi:putative membrane protein